VAALAADVGHHGGVTREGPIRHTETKNGDVLQVVAAAQGLRFRGAMYDMVDAPFDVFPKSVKILPSSRRLL
jgi:hypothetical protein